MENKKVWKGRPINNKYLILPGQNKFIMSSQRQKELSYFF